MWGHFASFAATDEMRFFQVLDEVPNVELSWNIAPASARPW